MKYLLKAMAVTAFLFTVGCSSNSQELRPLDNGVCNNPKCKCVKPCQCGSGCRCGMNGNSQTMADDTQK